MLNPRRKLLICVLFSFLLFVGLSADSYGSGSCTGRDATLACLKKQPSKLYSENMDLFWSILNEAASKANKCNNNRATADFLNLVQTTRDGAYAEYFGEHIENLCVSNTLCFLEGLMLLNSFDQDGIIYELYNPTFKEPSEITDALSKYKKNRKYQRVIDFYMQKNKPTISNNQISNQSRREGR